MSSEESIGVIATAYLVSVEALWTIKRFFELPKARFYEAVSPAFRFQRQNWRLRLWPNAFPSYVEWNLMMMDTSIVEPIQDFRCQIELRSCDGSNYMVDSKEFSMQNMRMGWNFALTSQEITQTLLINEAKAILPDGHLTLCCRLTVVKAQTEANYQTERLNPVLVTLSRNLKDLYIAEKDYDVTIKVKNETFRAHRAILGARTPVLAAMFSHSMAETETGVIRVEDCDPKAFAIFLLFVYSGATEKLTTESVTPVYYIADKYDLPELKEECVKYMLSNLTIDSVCNVIETAAKHGENALLNKATKFFQVNAKEIFVTPHWERFMVENTTQAKELIILAFNFASTK